ncbi:MAG: hypothetical protein H6624_14810 [Bdellovibrionaceae bacterium]|nr:hypothetical protein [Bdellovibrionales bacterium]MCB9085615.1 hypothetical protein [Pseudobdellovibrionaceae bacterium]
MDELRNKLTERATKARDKAAQAKKELDRKILDLTSTRFEKVRRILAEKRQKWEEDGDVAYKLAEKVLAKAKSIRENLVPGGKKEDPSSETES